MKTPLDLNCFVEAIENKHLKIEFNLEQFNGSIKELLEFTLSKQFLKRPEIVRFILNSTKSKNLKQKKIYKSSKINNINHDFGSYESASEVPYDEEI